MTRAASPPAVLPARPDAEIDEKVRRLPPYHVILLNDDDHSFEFVVHVLRQVFGYELEKAYTLTMEAHQQGRAVVWTGSKEVAELRVEQITTFHETRQFDNRKLGPLGCVIEPAPGG